MSKIRVEHKDGLTPFGAHFVVMADHCLVTGMKSDTEGEVPPQHVAINFEAITDMLVHHMAKFETGGGTLNIDGYVLPVKTAARIYIDAIATVLGNSGVSANLTKIRNELCAACHGSTTPAKEFAGDGAPPIAIPGQEQPVVAPGPATPLSTPGDSSHG